MTTRQFLPALLLISVSAGAQMPQQVRVNLHSATVFLSGAELASTAKVTLPAGETDILFTNIAGNVKQQSLNIGASNDVVIQSATFQNNFLADSAFSPRAKKLRDSIAYLQLQVTSTEDRRAVLDEQEDIIGENKKVAGANTGLSVLELGRLLDLVNTRLSKILAEQRLLNDRVTRAQGRIALLNQQLLEEQRKAFTPGGQLLVKFYARSPTSAEVNMSYVVPNAGWIPSYDLRVDKVNAPVKLFYKASVYQNSGVKWTNVKLSLSTGNPTEGVDAPVLEPWKLAIYNHTYSPSTAGQVTVTTRQYKVPLVSTRTSSGVRTRTAEQIESMPVTDLNSIASQSAGVYQSAGNLSIGGARPAGTTYLIDGIVMNGEQNEVSLNNYTAVDAGGINTTFDIDLPYSIPSDGQQHTVAIKDYELPATYRHFAVPKLDKDAFLQAQITKWEDLNLLPAQTNVFFEGSYVGQGFIDMRNVRDTMYLSLGRDKKIIIRRERDKTFQSEHTVGTNEREAFGWTITVRNTRKEPVHLVVMDKVPISTDDDIVVEDQHWGDAVPEPKTGALRWTFDLKPSAVKTLPLSFTIRYPRGKSIGNLVP